MHCWNRRKIKYRYFKGSKQDTKNILISVFYGRQETRTNKSNLEKKIWDHREINTSVQERKWSNTTTR